MDRNDRNICLERVSGGFSSQINRLLQGVFSFSGVAFAVGWTSGGLQEVQVFIRRPLGNEEKSARDSVLYKVSSEMTTCVDFCLRCHQNFAENSFSEKACSLKMGQHFSNVDPNRKFLSTSSVKKHVPFMAQKPTDQKLTSTTPSPCPLNLAAGHRPRC